MPLQKCVSFVLSRWTAAAVIATLSGSPWPYTGRYVGITPIWWQVSDVVGALHVVGGNNTVIHGVISGDCPACCVADLQNPDS